MIRKAFFAVLVVLVFSVMPAQALDLDPIPEGADIVLIVNNHSKLPLHEVVNAAPIPAMAREKMNEFFSAASFNPFRDIARVQLMVKKGETKRDDNAVAVLTGSFNQSKIQGFIKDKLGQGIDEENVNGLTMFKAKDGKVGLCIIDGAKAAIGTPPALKAYLEARGGSALSQEYEDLKKMLHEKPYAALMIGGKEFLKKEMEKNRERRQARLERKARKNPVGKMLEEYLSEGVQPTGVFAQLLESRVEAKIFYDRNGNKNSLNAMIEVIDPKITIEKLFGEILKVVPEIPAPENKPEKPVEQEKKGGTSRW